MFSSASWFSNTKIDICFLVCFDIHLKVVEDFKKRINMILYLKVYDNLPLVCLFIHVNLMMQYPFNFNQNICKISAFRFC